MESLVDRCLAKSLFLHNSKTIPVFLFLSPQSGPMGMCIRQHWLSSKKKHSDINQSNHHYYDNNNLVTYSYFL